MVAYTLCPNPACNELSLTVTLNKVGRHYGRAPMVGDLLKTWHLIPASIAKVFPDYVPQAVRDDYSEACQIRDLSPKAAATLARRCLQGMIRDFWKINKWNLKLEIEELKSKVDPLTWQAIDGVRGVGNVGAHMEKDINLIIDVEPEEAGLLIGLVEILVGDWYVARDTRAKALQSVVSLAEAKKAERKPNLANDSPSDDAELTRSEDKDD